MLKTLTTILLLLSASVALARGTYQEPREFLHQAFHGDPPPPKMVWLSGEVRAATQAILGHQPAQLRLRYWAREQRSAWILEEIGKEHPITVGVVVNAGKLESIKVLVFRESRGDEVRHPFFTEQFSGAALTSQRVLDRTIDGISGATLSVRALTKLARLALYLHQHLDTRHAAP